MEMMVNDGKQLMLLSGGVHRLPAIGFSRLSSRRKRFGCAVPRSRCWISSKKSSYQDFQSYIKPSRLLPVVTQQTLSTDDSLEKILSYTDEYHSIYTVNLSTSSLYVSSLSDANAGVLFCLIDENGYSMLHRLSATEAKVHSTLSENDTFPNDALHFQRGSVDVFTFYGPKLGRIEAIWMGLEAGQWRLGGVNLTVISKHQATNEEDKTPYISLQYNFETDDILLGEGSENSMVELRPRLVTRLSDPSSFTLFTTDFPQPTSFQSNEESMKAYTDLKLSLLIYDAILIFTGTAVANSAAGDEAALAFLFGGISGFLYLLLLQRSVDGLPTPVNSPPETKGNFQQMFEGFKSPVSGLALFIGLTILALKYGSSR